MHVLFYIDPLIEMGRPFFKETWSNGFCLNIVNSLRASGGADKYQFTFAINEPLFKKFKNPGNAEITVFSQSELMLPFKDFNYLDITRAWYEETYTDNQLEYYISLMKSKIEKAPDLIITFSPVPFLKRAFPSTLIFHHEYSLMSRAPYPQTWYFDIAGMNGGAYLSKYWDVIIEQMDFPEEHKNLVLKFKVACQELFKKTTPYNDLMDICRQRFEYLVLLPLQFSQYYLFDAHTHYKSQYDYLIDVLEKVPDNIGVVVTTHPDYNVLTSEVITYLQGKYINFIYNNEFENYHAASQYLLNHVDGVITVSSSLGLQTLITDKKLISLGKGFLNFMADSTTLEDVESVLQKEYVNKDKLLFWLLTHYAIPQGYINNPEWLNNFFVSSVQKYREGLSDAVFYDLIDDDISKLINSLINSLNNKCPLPTHPFNFSATKLKSICMEKLLEINPYKEAQLFIDDGTGFSEEQSQIQFINGDESLIKFDLKNYHQIQRLRFDPVNVSVALKIENIEIEAKDGKHKYSIECTNADYCDRDIYIFLDNDPQIILKNDSIPDQPLSITFTVQYLAFGTKIRDVYLDLLIKKDALIKDKDALIKDKEALIKDKEALIKEIETIVDNLNNIFFFRIAKKLKILLEKYSGK